jgi:5'-3' exonuclease
MKPIKVRLIDGNNQFLINYAKATSYQDLVRRCEQLHFGFDAVYWTWDGFDSRAKRREIFLGYKNTKSREKSKQDTTKYDLMNQFKKQDLPNIGGVYSIDIPKTEADDIIRSLVRLLKETNGDNILIEIASNDADLFDLTSISGVSQPQSKLPKNCGKPEDIPLYKTLVGDSGDNIKGLPGFGESTWSKLTPLEKEWIQHALEIEKTGFAIPEAVFNQNPKLFQKILDNWATIKMCYSLVNPIWVTNQELFMNLKKYPKVLKTNGTKMTMD